LQITTAKQQQLFSVAGFGCAVIVAARAFSIAARILMSAVSLNESRIAGRLQQRCKLVLQDCRQAKQFFA